MSTWKWNPVKAALRVPIYFKVIVANSVNALAVIVALLTSPTALVAGAVVIAAGITNALLVRAAFAMESQRRRQRELLAYTLAETESERQRVAQQLQDDAAQRLAALVLLSAGNRDVSQEAAAVMEELYATAQTLHPPGIRLLGLNAALKWYARTLERTCGVEVQLEVDDAAETLDESLALAIFRILEDVLRSAAQRAGTPLALFLAVHRTNVHATLHVPHGMTAAEQFRLTERAALLGGEVRITNGSQRLILSVSIPNEVNTHVRYDSRLAG